MEHIYSSILSNIIVFIICILFGKTCHRDAHEKMSQIHIFLTPIYVTIYFLLGGDDLEGFVIGIWFYFSFFHLIILNAFGILRRSFSLNILMTIQDDKGSAFNEVINNYAQDYGVGVNALRDIRLKAMIRTGLVIKENELYILTKKGLLITHIRSFVLRLFNLSSLNRSSFSK